MIEEGEGPLLKELKTSEFGSASAFGPGRFVDINSQQGSHGRWARQTDQLPLVARENEALMVNRPNSVRTPISRCTTAALWEDIIDGGATKEQIEYIAETARYKYKSLIYESD
jgi:hypothetical protein